jgi:hypothetical protein
VLEKHAVNILKKILSTKERKFSQVSGLNGGARPHPTIFHDTLLRERELGEKAVKLWILLPGVFIAMQVNTLGGYCINYNKFSVVRQ